MIIKASAGEIARIPPPTRGTIPNIQVPTDDDLTALLAAVPARHPLAYRMILSTGLRRDELRQLQWGDVKLNAPGGTAESTPGRRWRR